MSKARRRYLRTTLLGVAAMGTLIWAAIDQFGIPVADMVDLLLTTLLAVGVVIGVAGIGVSVWLGLRYLLRKRN
ncbi:MAG: hypothetical protein ABJK20_08635 [Halieaceae bacterium]